MKMLWMLLSICLLLSACDSISNLGLGSDNTAVATPLLDVKADLRVTPLWSLSIGKGSAGNYKNLIPAVDDNKVFAVDSAGQLFAIARDTGKILWHIKTGIAISTGVAASHGLILLSTVDSRLLAYEQASGRLKWQVEVPNQLLVPPVIADGRVIVKTVDGKLCAYTIEDGKAQWRYEHGAPALVLHTPSLPVIVNHQVIVGYADGKLAAYTLNEGKLIWERIIAYPAGSNSVEQIIDITPHLDNGIIFANSYSGKLAAVNSQTGMLAWQRDLPAMVGIAPDHNSVYVVDLTGQVKRLEASTGQLLKQQSTLTGRGLITPVVSNGIVLIGDAHGYLHFLSGQDLHIRARWLIHKKDAIQTPPLVVGQEIYTLTQQGQLLALRIE